MERYTKDGQWTEEELRELVRTECRFQADEMGNNRVDPEQIHKIHPDLVAWYNTCEGEYEWFDKLADTIVGIS